MGCMASAAVTPPSSWDRSFFGHPRGLSTLFFTEMWERFSYYGMRAILILFMTATVGHGGLGFPTSKAGSIYGLYTAMVFLMSMPGGWIADRIIGHRRAVFIGGVFITAGHFSIAVPTLSTFYAGLLFIVIGTGLLKPNMSTMVGALYSPTDARRDAGFSIFYMGINLGAMIAPLVCGYLAENINWHYGFSAAGVGMTLGLIQYAFGTKYLGDAGVATCGDDSDRRLFQRILIGIGVVAIVATGLIYSGVFEISAESLAGAFGLILTLIVVAFFTWLLTAKGYTPLERKRFWGILVLFISSSAFWGAYEQAGSTLNLFAERGTNLHAWDLPLWGLFRASYFQSFNSFFILALAPVFAWLWMNLGKRNPSIPAKFILGLVGVGAGFAILIPVANGTMASPWWLTLTYLLHTMGELCLSPVGLSATTKLAPARIAGLMMGVWFLSDSVGNYVGGMLAAGYEKYPLPELFGGVAVFCGLVALVMLAVLKPIKSLMGGVN
jgi:POT family proton-dependent oligopeptide transporter